jgi:hypothetical protein
VHSPYFVMDEDALPTGAAFHAAVAIEYLNKNQCTWFPETKVLDIDFWKRKCKFVSVSYQTGMKRWASMNVVNCNVVHICRNLLHHAQ